MTGGIQEDRCEMFPEYSDALCSGVDDVVSKLDFHTLGVRHIKIFLISPHELREENDFAQLGIFGKF